MLGCTHDELHGPLHGDLKLSDGQTLCGIVQNHPCAVLKQMLTLSAEESGPAEGVSDKEMQVKAWNETASSALAHAKIQGKLDMLGYGGVSCADLLKIAFRACSQVQTGVQCFPIVKHTD